MKEVTPDHLRSATGPAIFLTDRGTYIIIGQKADHIVTGNEIPVGDDEYAIIIDAAYLAGLKDEQD